MNKLVKIAREWQFRKSTATIPELVSSRPVSMSEPLPAILPEYSVASDKQMFYTYVGWMHTYGHRHLSHVSNEEWIAERMRFATAVLKEVVETDPSKFGSIPVLRGTRFTVAQLIAELSEGHSSFEIADDNDLDSDQVRKVLESLAIMLDRPALK